MVMVRWSISIIMLVVQLCLLVKVVALLRVDGLLARTRLLVLKAVRPVAIMFRQSLGKGEDAEAEAQVKALLGDHRVCLARMVIIGYAVMAFVWAPATVLEIITIDGVGSVSDVGLGAGLFILLLCAAAMWCPRLVHPHTLRTWHVAFMLACCVLASPLGMELGPHVLIVHVVGHVATASVSLIDPGLVGAALTNVCFAASMSASLSGLSADYPALGLVFVVPAELIIWGLKLAFLFVVHSLLHDSVCREVKEGEAKCRGLAMTSLLNLICDAVVDLDSDLVMKDHATKLANMLMHASGRSLQGVALQEYIVEGAGEQRFLKSIGRNSKGQSAPSYVGAFCTQMRDAMGNRVKVALFHVPYTTYAGETHHLIGIQEDKDNIVCTAAGTAPESGRSSPRPCSPRR